MKKYWKLFIPYYGVYYGGVINMKEVERSHPLIYFGSAIVQAICYAGLISYLFF